MKKKQSLLVSGLCLGLSAVMLTGTTLAWFTDSVTNTGNTIQAGTLEIALNKASSNATMFTTQEADGDTFWWEPGRSQKATATVTNEGNLWLKYTMSFANVEITGSDTNPDADITEVLDVYVVENKTAENVASTDLNETGNYLGTMAYLMEQGYFGYQNQELAPVGTEGEDTDTFTVVIKMQESATNLYQGCTVDFDILVNATQYTKEQDGFGSDQYDAGSEYRLTDAKAVDAALEGDQLYVDFVTDVQVNSKITGDKIINGHGASMKAPTGQALWIEGVDANVTVENVVFEGGGNNSVVKLYEAKSVTFKNCVFQDGYFWTAFEEVGDTELVFENCTFNYDGRYPVSINVASWADKDHYTTCDITFRNCEIQGDVQHLVHLNNKINGTLTLEGCTLNNQGAAGIGTVSALWIQGAAEDGKVNITVTDTDYTGPQEYRYVKLVHANAERVNVTVEEDSTFSPNTIAVQ